MQQQQQLLSRDINDYHTNVKCWTLSTCFSLRSGSNSSLDLKTALLLVVQKHILNPEAVTCIVGVFSH